MHECYTARLVTHFYCISHLNTQMCTPWLILKGAMSILNARVCSSVQNHSAFLTGGFVMALSIVYMEKMNNNVIITNVQVSTCVNGKICEAIC